MMRSANARRHLDRLHSDSRLDISNVGDARNYKITCRTSGLNRSTDLREADFIVS
jgi:hypothetical protein